MSKQATISKFFKTRLKPNDSTNAVENQEPPIDKEDAIETKNSETSEPKNIEIPEIDKNNNTPSDDSESKRRVDDHDPAPSSKRLKVDEIKRTFQADWLKFHSWLEHRDGKMFCRVCIRQNKCNNMTAGTTSFRYNSFIACLAYHYQI